MNSSISTFKVTIDMKRLTITNGETKMINFPSTIQQIERFKTAIVVRVHPKTSAFLNENIFGVSYDGKILWQIEKLNYVYKNSPFTGISKNGDSIKLHNWDGTDLIVDPATGDILEKSYSK